MTKLEELLKGVTILLTDKVVYFSQKPIHKGETNVENPNFYWWRFKSKGNINRSNTLFLATDNKQYSEIAENLYEAVTGIKTFFNRIKQEDKKVLYKSIVENKNYNK
jgi:hypothetical protein